MEDNISLKEKKDLYPKLSQEEIVALYESEGICEETIIESLDKLMATIEKKQKELGSLKGNDAEARLLRSLGINNDEHSKITNLKKIISELDKKLEEFYDLRDEMQEIFSSSESCNNISDIIDKLNKEINDKRQELELEEQILNTLNEQKNSRINELKTQIEQLEKSKYKFKNYAHTFYLSTRGIKPKNRKFPSRELRNKIVCGTLGYAKYWANIYYRKSNNQIPFDDLFQIASEALISAAHYYVPSDRAKFSTYARRCIENKLKREVYNKKKKKKSKKGHSFFQDEENKIAYIKMFLKSSKFSYSKESGNFDFENYTSSMSVNLSKFRMLLLHHNREMIMREENCRLLPSFKNKKAKGTLELVVNNIIKMLHESKMKVLITEEDRQLASLLVNYQNKALPLQELHQFIYLLDCYISKLDLIDKYLKAEKKLMTQNNGITPSDEEILEEINKNIKLDNQERFKLRKESSFPELYQRYYDYYSEYKALYDVDPFITPEEYECEGYSSKEKERDDIIYEFCEYELEDVLDSLDRMARLIRYSKSEKIVLYSSNEISHIYDSWDEYDEFTKNCDGEVYLKSDAIKKVEEQREQLPNLLDEYVKGVLQERKERVNAILKEKNKPILEHNREVKKQQDRHALGTKYQSYMNENQIEEIKTNIESLYDDEDDVIVIMSYDNPRNKNQVSKNLPLEDEALNNLFLEDYYTALGNLPVLEQEVLLRYYDRNGVHSMTAKEIGKELGISQGKVYRVKQKALGKLSQNPRIKSYNEE